MGRMNSLSRPNISQIEEPQNPRIDKFHVVQERHPGDFKAL